MTAEDIKTQEQQLLCRENCLLRTKPDCWTPEICYGRFIAWLHSPLPVALVLPLCTPSHLIPQFSGDTSILDGNTESFENVTN